MHTKTAKAHAPHNRSTSPATAPLSGAHQLAEKQKAIEIAAATGCDPRTALRAIRNGPDVIKTLRLREELRPYVEDFRAKLCDEGRVA